MISAVKSIENGLTHSMLMLQLLGGNPNLFRLFY